jgi:hypothetical protein
MNSLNIYFFPKMKMTRSRLDVSLLCLHMIFLIGSGDFALFLFLQSINVSQGDLYGNSHEASISPDGLANENNNSKAVHRGARGLARQHVYYRGSNYEVKS